MTTHHDVLNDPLVREHALLHRQGGDRRWPTRRSGTAARSAVRWPTPTRPVTCGAPALALGRRVRDRRARAASARSRPTTSSSTSSRPPSARTSCSPRSASPSTPGGARTTRSSSGWPTSGRSWRSPRRCKADGGTISEARVGLTNMGSTPLRARGVEEALAGAATSEDGVRDGRRAGRRRHQPAVGPQRVGRVPQAPGQGAHPARRVGGGGRLSDGSHPPVHRPRPDRRGLGALQRHRLGRGVLPGRVGHVGRGRHVRGLGEGQARPIALVYNGTGTFTEKDEATHRMVVDAKGKDKRGNGTAGARS